MKKQVPLMVGILSLLAVSPLVASGEGWGEDFAKAKTEANLQKKYLFLDFTGSDWCGWCMKIDKDVFSKEEFKAFAKEKLVLVTVDFPNKKPQSATIKMQNEKLKQTYGANGFPTLILLNPSGKEVKRWVGYNPNMLAELRAAVASK